MARLKIAYVGGGGTRAPGTIASFVARGDAFIGSSLVLVDLDEERLALVRALAQRQADARGVDLAISATTDRRRALADCDVVVTSYRPGGFEARHLDESVPLRHGVIGQETQGPGGFFMALRSIHVMKEIVAEMERLCPNALLVNYTNPVNIVSQAVADNSDARILSCEGPLRFPLATARAASLDPARLETAMAGLNHACWTVRHLYDGEDVIPLLRRAYDERRSEGEQNSEVQLLALAAAVGAIPSTYLLYYHYRDEKLAELRANPTTRAQDILAEVPAYWRHYAEQAEATEPELDPARSRGGIDELEIAVAVIDAIANDRPAVWPVNLRNNGAIPGLPDELVVEVSCAVDGRGARALPSAPLPPAGLGLIEMLAEYQRLAAQAAWDGSAKDALRALVSNPLVLSPTRAEAIYRELAAAQRDYLPERLWP